MGLGEQIMTQFSFFFSFLKIPLQLCFLGEDNLKSLVSKEELICFTVLQCQSQKYAPQLPETPGT